MDRNEQAETIAAALTADGMGARVWEGGGKVRVYVSRDLSRRSQEMGYVEVLDGERNYHPVTRRAAHVRDLCEAAIAATSAVAFTRHQYQRSR